MKHLAVLLLFASQILPGQQPDSTTRPDQAPPQPLYLNVIVPGNDTVRNSPSRHRIAANTNVTSRAFINGVETKVYASGAFVGLYRPESDTSQLTLTVVGVQGDTLSRSFTFFRPAPVVTSPHDTLVIEEDFMLPERSVWLMKDDVLEVRFKGSPGWEASFSIPDVADGIPMRELTAREARGLGGMYAGKYIVKEGDLAIDQPIEFRLKKSFWTSEKVSSRALISIMPDSLPRTGVIVGRRPYINVGLGTDRLGGAKLGYVEPGGKVNVTGKIGRQYRIRLSEDLEAWIPAEYVDLLPIDTPPPASLANSISVTGTDTEDHVYLGLSERLPYRIDQVDHPTAVYVDVYGATSNTNWITHHSSAEGVASVSWNQIASDHYRLVIELTHEQHWGTAVSYSGNGLSIRIRRPPVVPNPERPFEGLTIALDAGHGGDARGALGSTGAEESVLNMAMIQQLDSVIQARGGKTVLTRNGDLSVSMTERAELIIGSGAHILVSIHCNSTGISADPVTVSGTAMFYRYLGFKPLADLVFAEMIKTGLKEFGVVGSFNFSLNGPTEVPNILVETAFMSNPEDEMFLLNAAGRTEIAVRVADGVGAFISRYGARSEE